MWPFKKKEIPICINCIHCETGVNPEYVHCLRSKKENKSNLVNGTSEVNDCHFYCLTERKGILFWDCGKKGRYFKDKTTWE